MTTPDTVPATEITFGVVGMTCASCVRRIEKALCRVAGVSEASVNLATERARVVFDPARAMPEQLEAAVIKAGYAVHERLAPRPSDVSPPPARPAASADMGELVLPIEGMRCASCVRRVEKALKRVEGVAKASVNLATEKATVRLQSESVPVEQLRTAVERAGYKVG